MAYIKITAANSPRPGAWILERSIDGEQYHPWQYFATSDKECFERYGLRATKDKPRYVTDDDVICTSAYSKLMPVENGEVRNGETFKILLGIDILSNVILPAVLLECEIDV